MEHDLWVDEDMIRLSGCWKLWLDEGSFEDWL